MARPATLQQDTDGERDTSFARDLYLLAPATLPAGMQYAVSSGDGQALFFVKRHRRGRSLTALAGAVAVGFVVSGFVSAVADSAGVAVLSGTGLAVGLGAGLLAAVGAYVSLVGKRFVSFARRDRGAQKVLDAEQSDRRHPFQVSFAITGERGRLLATVRRNYLTGLLRTAWTAYGAQGEALVQVREESWLRALGNRCLGWAAPRFRSNFNFVGSSDAAILATLKRRELIQGRHVLDLRVGGPGGLDPQVALALAVLVDVCDRG
jgi:hypothetical protein